jgi:hypothetical protein
MTKYELAQLVLNEEELPYIDTTLPQLFVDDCINLLNIDPRPLTVWFNKKVGGYPINLAERFYMKYRNVEKLRKASETLLVDAIDRDEVWPEHVMTKDKNKYHMFDDWRELAFALDQMEFDKDHLEHNVRTQNNGR